MHFAECIVIFYLALLYRYLGKRTLEDVLRRLAKLRLNII